MDKESLDAIRADIAAIYLALTDTKSPLGRTASSSSASNLFVCTILLAEDRAAGLVWRARDANNYYVVRANALEDNVVLYKTVDGARSALDIVR